MENLRVSDLMSTTGKYWNYNFIYALIGGGEATKVLNAPLFEVDHVDKLLWKLEKNGRFSMCSAYRYCIGDAIDTSHLMIDEN